MQLRSQDISDPSLRAFWELLRHNGLHNIVIAGGAVRDLLSSRPIRDIDVAARIPRISPLAVHSESPYGAAQLTGELRQALAPLARVLGCPVSALRNAVPFQASSIDVLGLAQVEDADGLAYPDIFIDKSGTLFNARPELTVNQLILDADGRVMPDAYVRDLIHRTGRLTPAPLPMRLRQVLRSIKTIRLLSLRATSETLLQLTTSLQHLQDEKGLQQQLGEADSRYMLKALAPEQLRRGFYTDHCQMFAFLEEMIHDIPRIH